MLTKEDVVTLCKPFPLSAHEFRQKLVYLTEFAVTSRLDDVDPNWSMAIEAIRERGSTITIHVALTVKDVTRHGIGMETVRSAASGSEANEAEKSAATDALKRAARLFGIGRYLLEVPNGTDNEAALGRWLTSLSGQSQKTAQPEPAKQQPAQPANGNGAHTHWAKDPARMEKYKGLLRQHGLSFTEGLNALKVDALEDASEDTSFVKLALENFAANKAK